MKTKPLSKQKKETVAPRQTTIVRSSPGGGYPEENPSGAKSPVIPPEKKPGERCDPKTQRCESTLGTPPPEPAEGKSSAT